MIHNQQQLERNQYWIGVMIDNMNELIALEKETNIHPTLYKAQIDGMQSLIKDLQAEVDNYLAKPLNKY